MCCVNADGRLCSKESFDDVVRTRDQILRLKQEDSVPIVIVGSESPVGRWGLADAAPQTSAT